MCLKDHQRCSRLALLYYQPWGPDADATHVLPLGAADALDREFAEVGSRVAAGAGAAAAAPAPAPAPRGRAASRASRSPSLAGCAPRTARRGGGSGRTRRAQLPDGVDLFFHVAVSDDAARAADELAGARRAAAPRRRRSLPGAERPERFLVARAVAQRIS